MASRKITICDLTGDSSSDEDSPVVATKISTIISEPACEPLQSLQNNARPAPKSITPALKSAIASLSEDRLREELEQICRHDVARIDLETRLLVMGNQVSRYHADSESENEKEDKEGSDGDGSKSSDSVHQKSIKSMLPISIAEDEWTPRFAKCENCDEEFDVTENDERSCFWHTGAKEVDYDAEFWADHDEDCHGSYESYEDDFEAQGGFTWSCCETAGDNEGCKITKHKADVAKVNILKAHILTPMDTTNDSGRMAQMEKIAIPSIKALSKKADEYCDRCSEAYNPRDNEKMKCYYHPGKKEVDEDSDVWNGHNVVRGPYEMFQDDIDYADGFTWTCCGSDLETQGCEPANHVPEGCEYLPGTQILPMSNKRKAEEELSRPAAHLRVR